jgi:hypothetical protein
VVTTAGYSKKYHLTVTMVARINRLTCINYNSGHAKKKSFYYNAFNINI